MKRTSALAILMILFAANLTSKWWGYAHLGLWIQTLGKFWITIDSELTCSLLAPAHPAALAFPPHSRYSSNTIFYDPLCSQH